MAITTTYDGIEYRSRLEARWAAFMKNIGWDIVYEPFDGDGYIPDVLVQGPSPMLVEVKPAVTLAEYEAAVPKAERGLAAHWSHDILIVGASPVLSGRFGNSWGSTAGWLGEFGQWGDADTWPDGPEGWCWEAADWIRCTNCGSHSIFHTVMTFSGRPCGCYNGDHYLGNAATSLLESFWADACNDVKWRGRAA